MAAALPQHPVSYTKDAVICLDLGVTYTSCLQLNHSEIQCYLIKLEITLGDLKGYVSTLGDGSSDHLQHKM